MGKRKVRGRGSKILGGGEETGQSHKAHVKGEGSTRMTMIKKKRGGKSSVRRKREKH